MSRLSSWLLLLSVVLSGLSCDSSVDKAGPAVSSAPPLAGDSTIPSEKVTLNLATTKGLVVVELYPDWAPIGVKRVTDLVKIGFFDDVAFFRVVPDFIVQFGMNGDPKLNAEWAENNIQDDPVKHSNKRGYVTFAKTGAPNSRSSQLFISLNDNPSLDRQGFAPIGRVVKGMEFVDQLNAEHGEEPQQPLITAKGNAYLKPNFPKLDYVTKATLGDVETPAPSKSDEPLDLPAKTESTPATPDDK